MAETTEKTKAVFGDSANSVIAWSNTTIEKFGIGRQAALDMASQFGAMGISMGVPC